MKKLFIWVSFFIIRQVMKLRYRVTYKGIEEVKKALKKNTDGVLFLPNHPAVFNDPLFVVGPVLTQFSVRPVVTEYMYFSPLFFKVMQWIKAIPVPNFATGVNPLKLARLEKSLKHIEEGIQRGESFLLYPAGMTKQTGREVIGGSFAAHQLISKYPDVKVVLVRTTGLWGSRFSRAFTRGRQVNMTEMLKRSVKDLLRNFIFFMPKREVTVTFEMAPKEFPRYETKQVMNKFLESWYNKPFENLPTKSEPLALVSYSRWKKDIPTIETSVPDDLVGKLIPKEIEIEVVQKIAEIGQLPVEQITSNKHLVADLGLDSLNFAELITFLETRFDIEEIDPQQLNTVAHVLLAATHQLEVVIAQEPEWDKDEWEKPRKPERLLVEEGQTIPDVFFDISYRHLFSVVAADSQTGPVTYHMLRSRVILLANAIEKLPGRRVGILLPACIASNVLVIACHLAGKVPVMINWTIGGRHLESVVQASQLEAVLTSWAFLDKLENVDLSAIQNMLFVLEEMRATFSLWSLLTSPLKAYLPGRWIKRLSCFSSWANMSGHSEAVILFTSGTEAIPKGVPLSHRNILSNIRSALQAVELYSSDRLLSMLPPFHSFGFTITGLMPLLVGMRVFFTPNPTDSGLHARAIRNWGLSLVCSAPSFLMNLLRQGREAPYEQVRLLVSGAEKAPLDLFNAARVAAPNASIWEGYGITECSPILCLNTKGERRFGVGRPIPGVHLLIVNADDFSQVMPVGESGMILATGPNVFKGYLQADIKSPFHNEDGVIWYITGDVGFLDEHGYLTITGRLKRFVKIGGEMISLGAIETALNIEESSGEGEGPRLAVCAKGESEGKARLVLFSTKQYTTLEVNSLLRKKGFSNLIKIDKVITMKEIPLTGTGKIAYRDLESTLV